MAQAEVLQMFFTPPPVDNTHQATVSEVKANLRQTLEDASKGIETLVTRHGRILAVVVSPSAHNALRHHRRAVAQAFESALKRVARIRRETERGLEPPGDRVADLMEAILEQLREVLEIGPDRTVRTCDGGIDTYFFSSEKRDDGSSARSVSLGVDSDGDASILFSSGEDDAAEDLTRETDLASLAARITDFLGGEEHVEPPARAGADTE